jgi:tetratricopeptide (TPR) repeat protein
MKRGSRRALQACAFLMGVPAFAADLGGARVDLQQVDESLSNLERRYLVPELMERSNRLTARLNDGQLLFIMKDYDRAAMALLDVVDDPKNRSHPAYRDALFYLAESLFALRNYRPASQYFAEVTSVGTPSQRQQSVARLLEIALATHDAAAAQIYLARAGELANQGEEPTLYYAIGKFHYRQGNFAEATTWFQRITETHPLHRRSLYFAGVGFIRQNKLAEATTAFEHAISVAADPAGQADEAEEAEIGDLARLAVARILYERGELAKAVEAYESIDKASKHYDKGVYESVWISIKEKDYEASVRKLEILLIAQPEVLHGADSRLLQGRLLLMLGRYEESQSAFNQVLYEFNPIRDDMQKVVDTAKGDLEGHFNRVIGRNLANFDLTTFLPPKAAEFAGPDMEADRAVVLVGDLAQEKRDVDEAQRTIERLDALLNAPNRVEVFPNLLEGVLQGLEARATLAAARVQLNEKSATPALRSDPEYTRLREARRGWESRYADIPRTAQALQQRDKKVDAQIRELDKSGFALNVQIRGLEAQLAAISKYVEDTVASKGGTGREKAVYDQVARELAETVVLRDEYEKMARGIEMQRLSVGVNDAASNEDEKIRQSLAAALDAEEAYLASHGAPVAAAERSRISQLDARAVAFLQKTATVVDEKVAELKHQVDRERQNIGTYGGELVTYQGQTESLGGTIAARSFRAVHDRVESVVLEADVGSVDIAWKQKQDQTKLIADTRAKEREELEVMERELKEATGD